MLLPISILSLVTDVTVDVNTSTTHRPNRMFLGCHSDSGYTHQPRGFFAQLIMGESFEIVPPAADIAQEQTSAVPSGLVSLRSAAGTSVRHCSYQLFATSRRGSAGDFAFNAVPALNGAANAVSFQSSNFHDRYITSTGVDQESLGDEVARLGIVAPGVDVDAASFTVVPGLSGNGTSSFRSLSKGNVSGHFLAINHNLRGACAHSYTAPESDVVLLAAPDAAAASWTVYAPPPAPATYEPWLPTAAPTAVGTADITTDESFHGTASLRINYTDGVGLLGMSNRGLGREGLYLLKEQPYEGYLFAKAANGSTRDALLTVSLRRVSGEVLASSTLTVPARSNWTQYHFSLTPSGGTACVDAAGDPSIMCTPPDAGTVPGHACVSCGGEFALGLTGPGVAYVDYVYLSPGAWGRYKGLPVLKSGVDVLKSMGVSLIRQGGSYASRTPPFAYFWKRWRGKPWTRPSVSWEWRHSLISGWGPFEFVDMCNAAGITPVLTTQAQDGECCAPEDMADLVEYCYGGPSSKWGAQRVADGHPDVYNVSIFELGNEQYNSLFPQQVKAMEARAASLGMGGKLYYMSPNNAHWLDENATAEAEALGLKDHLLSDEHVGGGGGVSVAKQLFGAFPNQTFGACNAETNAGTHHVTRMLQEAADLNDWLSHPIPSTSGDAGSRLKFRTASFCTERSGHFDAWDQGMSFFLPNMTWLQPPGHVHAMVAQSWQPLGLATTLSPPPAHPGYNAPYSASAAKSEDGKILVARVVNMGTGAQRVTFEHDGKTAPPPSRAVQIADADGNNANPPAEPDRVAPRDITAAVARGWAAAGALLELPGQSFTTLTWEL